MVNFDDIYDELFFNIKLVVSKIKTNIAYIKFK